MYNSKITGLGHYVPDHVVSNDDLSKLMDNISPSYIGEVETGVKEASGRITRLYFRLSCFFGERPSIADSGGGGEL